MNLYQPVIEIRKIVRLISGEKVFRMALNCQRTDLLLQLIDCCLRKSRVAVNPIGVDSAKEAPLLGGNHSVDHRDDRK